MLDLCTTDRMHWDIATVFNKWKLSLDYMMELEIREA